MSGVPYVFGNATTSIPLSQLDVNFATNATIGTTSVGLGNTTTTLVGLTNVSTTVVNTSNVSANTSLLLQTNGTTTAVTIDTNQNVGVGVTPVASARPIIQIGNSSSVSYFTASNIGIFASNMYYDGAVNRYINSNFAYQYVQSGGNHIWQTAPSGTAGASATFTSAMTLDSSGNLLVGVTSATYGSQFQTANASNPALYLNNSLTSSLGNSNVLRLAFSGADINNGSCSFIQAYGTTTLRFVVDSRGNVANLNNSYGAISDVKLKENIVDATPKLADLMQVKVRNYNLKSDPTHKQLGVIAQELETVFPSMVDESPDRDTEGNDLGTTTKSVKYSVFVPMLIKAIQELSAQVTTLQTQVTALKG